MGFILSKHEIYPNSVIVRTFTGKLRIEDIINSWEGIENKIDLNKNIVGIINDLRDCQFDINIRKLKVLESFLKEHPNIKTLKLAVITNSPKTITLPLIIMRKVRGLQIEIFTTFEAADKWIMPDLPK